MSAYTPETYIMKSMFDTLKTPEAGVNGFLETIKPKIPALMFMIFVKKLLDNSGTVLTSFLEWSWSVVKRLIYTEVRLEASDASKFEYHLGVNMENNKRSMTERFVPMYFIAETTSCPYHYYSYCYPFHRSEIAAMKSAAQVDLESYIENVKNKSVYKHLTKSGTMLTYSTRDHSNLYPSNNFVKLEEIIKSHFEVSDLAGTYSVLGMLIDGVPGLGKTKFADYATGTKLAVNVYKCDATNFLQVPFDLLSKSMFHEVKINATTIFLVDEIDKYLDYQVTHRIGHQPSVVLDESKIPQPVVEEDNVFKKKFKETFLYEMLSILERDGLKHSVVVIFCSNNFESVFEGVDITHFKSLYNRLMKVRFDMCDHSEVVKYLMHYNKLFVNTKHYCDITEDQLGLILRKDLQITHRELHHLSVQAKYNAETIVELLNAYKSEDLNEGKVKSYSNKNSPSRVVRTRIESPTPRKVAQRDVNVEESSDEVCEDDEGEITEEDREAFNNIKVVAKNVVPMWGEQTYDQKAMANAWEQNYANKALGVEDNDISNYVVRTKGYFAKMETCRGRVNKARCVTELFQYIHDEGYPLLIHNRTFKSSVVSKIQQLREIPEILEELTPGVKQLIFALTGVKC